MVNCAKGTKRLGGFDDNMNLKKTKSSLSLMLRFPPSVNSTGKQLQFDQVVHPFSPDAFPGPVNRTVPGEGKAIDYIKIFLDDKYRSPLV